MERAEFTLTIVLLLVNLMAGIGLAIPIARLLGRVLERPLRVFRYFLFMIGLYFMECVAFPAGMATQVLSIGLAFVWGVILGLWMRGRAQARQALKTSFYIALYSTLPTVSFAVVLNGMKFFMGESILSAEAGARFGIPAFLRLPWPLNTILGFFGAIAIVTVVFKTVITTGEVSLLIHLGEKSVVDKC